MKIELKKVLDAKKDEDYIVIVNQKEIIIGQLCRIEYRWVNIRTSKNIIHRRPLEFTQFFEPVIIKDSYLHTGTADPEQHIKQ